MSVPPTYPRIPHLVPSRAVTADDDVLAGGHRNELLELEVVVEEKLDGMNVCIWLDGGAPRVATRGGTDAIDRSGERGRVKAWAAMRRDRLAAALGEDLALYGEWLRRRHGVAYERLPDVLMGLDVYDRRRERFLGVDERDAVLERLGVAKPPVVFHGVLGSLDRLATLLGPSAYASGRAEGLVVRARGQRLVAKLVDPAWHAIGTLPWRGENRVAGG